MRWIIDLTRVVIRVPDRSPRLVVVVPRYGSSVLGGAETQARGFAHAASRRGWTVEVWTTCAESHYDWRNTLAAGTEYCDDLVIRRFPITSFDSEVKGRIDADLDIGLRVAVDDELTWLASGAHSQELYVYARQHSHEFDAVVLIPYASPLIIAAAACTQAVNRIVWPCLHDEPYAYMRIVRWLLESASGVMFLSPEERDLAVELLHLRLTHHSVVGGGMCIDDGVAGCVVSDVTPPSAESSGETSPYLLYAGRLEAGKNLDTLYSYVLDYSKRGGSVVLKVIGGGPLKPPHHPAFRYLGYVTQQRIRRERSGALALCQPSLNESFSMVMMESWLSHRPVLVHAECAVTTGHVRRSSGGLYFRDSEEFANEVDWFLRNPSLADRMGANGYRYVVGNYRWSAVLDRFQALLESGSSLSV